MLSGTRIALFHDDSEVADAIIDFATEAELEVVHPASSAALEAELSNPLVAAVVLDLSGPRNGGFELLERVANAPCRPLVIVVTTLDSKTVESIRRLGSAKEINLRVFRKGEDEPLRTCIAALEKRQRHFTAEHLDEAIDQQLLRVEYQPKVPLATNEEDYAVEALCRLRHPQFGNVFPDQFIPIAEKHGLIAKLTDCVISHAFRDLSRWRAQGIVVRLAINISPELLRTPQWCEQFMERCKEFQVEPSHITLEITESSSGATLDVALDVLTRLRLKGFMLSIDDFGTGFSSLAALYKLPFTELKIDKSFTFDFQESAEARALIESTIGMAQRLGLKVVAEGVETEAVFRELRILGCQQAQGYFISKSIPADEVPQFFAGWTSMMRNKPLHEENALPKIAIIQTLLSDILSDNFEDDSTVVLSGFEAPGTQEDSTLQLTQKIPSLVLQGQVSAALGRCHAALRRLERKPDRAPLKGKIVQLRQLLEHELLCTNDLEIATATGPVRLLARHSAFIGRPSSGKSADVAVGCRWFSRGDKNLRLFQEGEDWFIEDLGSTNGHSIGDRLLHRGKPVKLPYGETVIEVGKQAGSIAPVAINLRRPPASPGTVIVTLAADEMRLSEGDEQQQWPSWREDTSATWVVLDGRMSIGSSKHSAVVIPELQAENAAEIWFQDGFWIASSAQTPLAIADTPFAEPVPLPAETDISIAGLSFRAKKYTAPIAVTETRAAPQAKAG